MSEELAGNKPKKTASKAAKSAKAKFKNSHP